MGAIPWGSDRWERPCEICLGDKCAECGNKGWIMERVPPGEILTAVGTDLFRAYRMLKDYGSWPAPGGWPRQTAKFIAVLDFCDNARNLYQARVGEKAEEAAKMQKAIAEAMGKR